LAFPGQVQLARWKTNLARLGAVEVDHRVRVDVVGPQRDAPAGPLGGEGHLALIPRGGDVGEGRIGPARVGDDRLAVLLQPVLDARPGAGHLEVAPALGRHRIGPGAAGLPAPQAVDADALTGRRGVPLGAGQVPDGPRPLGQRGFLLGLAERRGKQGGEGQAYGKRGGSHGQCLRLG